MSELLTMQDLANGHLDVKALGELANGDENTIVTTRTGNTYPSAERAINIMFQNGGLPATPFTTKALMAASSLVDGDYAVVTDDSVGSNNGYYQKKAGAWSYVKFNNKGSSRTMYHFQGSYTVVPPTGNGNVLVGATASQSPVRVADVSGSTEAVVDIKKMRDGFAPTTMFIKVYFYGQSDVTVSGVSTEPQVVAEREIQWATDRDSRTVFDVRDYSGMLLVLQIRPAQQLTNESIKFNFFSSPFDINTTNKAIVEMDTTAINSDIAIGQDKISGASVPIADVRDFTAVRLQVKPIVGCKAAIILRLLYFKKNNGLITLSAGNNLIHGHTKYTEPVWLNPATESFEGAFDVSGYDGFVAIAQARAVHEIAGKSMSVRMWADNNPVLVQKEDASPRIFEQKFSFSADQLFTGLVPKKASSVVSLLDGLRDISIWVATEFPIPINIEAYDKRTTATKPVLEWDGEKFVPKTYQHSVLIPAAVNNLDVFDVTNAFKFDHTTTLDLRALASRSATGVEETHLNGVPRTITFIVRGVK